MAGYHSNEIPKGTLGEFSKIREEFLELEDAHLQGNRILVLCELADLVGAIDHYLRERFAFRVSLDDVLAMKAATERAFLAGERS